MKNNNTLKPAALAAALLASALSAHAQDAEPAKPETQTLPTVTISADASAKGLARPYAGGQVARGGRAGILGTLDNIDSPFTITAYTNELIQDLQAKSVADVLQNDAGVRVARGYGNFQEAYFIRGFILSSDDIAYNGLYSLLPRQYIATELFERVEVLRGASAFLMGASPNGGAIGGNINLVPKRAPNVDLNRVTVQFGANGQHSVALDIARRFGPDNATGVRVNLAQHDGGTSVDHEKNKLGVAELGLDWKSADVRLSGDIGWQDNRLKQTRPSITLGYGVTALPALPDASSNMAQPWSYSNEKDVFGTLRGEWDINKDVTAWAAWGMRRNSEANSLAGFTLTNAATGDGTTNRFDNTRRETISTGEVGLRANVNVGGVKNALVVSASYFLDNNAAAYVWDYFNNQNTNLYHPVYSPLPAFSGVNMFQGNKLADPARLARNELSSVALGDTVTLFDDRLLLTLGARAQSLKVENFAYDTGAASPSYDKSRVSPVFGAVWKFSKQLSVYANNIQGLSKGDTYTNGSGASVTLAPYISRQQEVGVKYDAGREFFSAALFTTTKPRVLKFGQPAPQGEDRHRGIELNTYGELAKGVRLLGGYTWLDTKQENTGDATTEGKQTLGIPRSQANLGLDADVRGIEGLAVYARLLHTGSAYADSANTLSVPSWNRMDIGARYAFEAGRTLYTVRGALDNVSNRKYWSSAGGYPDQGYLVIGAPRTFSVSLAADF